MIKLQKRIIVASYDYARSSNILSRVGTVSAIGLRMFWFSFLSAFREFEGLIE